MISLAFIHKFKISFMLYVGKCIINHRSSKTTTTDDDDDKNKRDQLHEAISCVLLLKSSSLKIHRKNIKKKNENMKMKLYFIMCCRLSQHYKMLVASSLLQFPLSSILSSRQRYCECTKLYWERDFHTLRLYINLSSTQNKAANTHREQRESSRRKKKQKCNIIWMRNSVAEFFNVVYSVLCRYTQEKLILVHKVNIFISEKF